jgi:penicillin-binding protein 1C
MSFSGWLRPRRHRGVVCGIAAAALSAVVLGVYVRCAPFDAPGNMMTVPGNVVLDANGGVLQRDGKDGFRIPVTLAQVAPAVVDATVAAEDQRFEEHPGVDPVAAVRAAASFRSNPSGASTITQQLARRLYLRDDGGPRLVRKMRESVIALQIEAHRSKDEILQAYLNEVYYGRGAYGIEAAARVYFGVSARNLDVAQAAMLAGIPQLPTANDPRNQPEAARARQRYVLGRMAATGKIDRATESAARSEELHILPAVDPAIAPHFVAYALDELYAARPDLRGRRGLIIETTLDAGLQQSAERTVQLRLNDIKEKGAGNAAVVAIDPASGRIVGMIGSADFFDEAGAGQVNMAIQPRQPGSALKPFLYAAALEHGYTAASQLLDVPTAFQTPNGLYAPGNYDRKFHGPLSLRVALASSFNVPAVRTLNDLGIDTLLEMTNRFGLRTLTTAEAYGLSLTLGGGDVRLLDLTNAYGALANGGELVQPFAVARVRDGSGKVLYEHEAPGTARVLSPEHAYIISDILADRDARTPGFGEVTPLELSFPTAVKTGTTTGFRDNWTVGYTSELAVGVWVGNTDNRAMENISGVSGAAPIWRDVMETAAKRIAMSWPQPPGGLVRAAVCAPTGLRPGPDCASPSQEWFVAGTEPAGTERYYVRDRDGRLLVNPPAEARAWALDAGVALADGAPAQGDDSLYIVLPSPGSLLFLSPELDQQQLLLRASVPASAERVSFVIDGSTVGQAPGSDPKLVWRLEPGLHRLEVIATLADGRAVTAESTYEVRPR